MQGEETVLIKLQLVTTASVIKSVKKYLKNELNRKQKFSINSKRQVQTYKSYRYSQLRYLRTRAYHQQKNAEFDANFELGEKKKIMRNRLLTRK